MSDNPVSTDGTTPEGSPVSTTDAPEGKTFSEDYVKSLRDEAAAARVGKKEAVDTAKTETRAEVIAEYEPQMAEKDTQIATLTADLATAQVENQKLRAVLGSEGVAAGDVLDLVDLVQGSDEESISESVKRVLAVYGKRETKSPAYDPSQGMGGGNIPLNGDPVLNILKQAVGA
ncbi:scaffolding protein [Mycobacterium phage Stephig9]|uniref:Scaffolding protein n=1 Tax=Mycobacterium phage Stephig9 TaxID=2591224 RepID=A0A514DH68_9CAUD|nr:head scaffolding protein [Mycobacterium phage Fredward]AGY36957.1 scaffold protein [Mycobacterium phage Fredward]QDH92966.1 scaffolding protein [Mycobacterium phage Stephig9]